MEKRLCQAGEHVIGAIMGYEMATLAHTIDEEMAVVYAVRHIILSYFCSYSEACVSFDRHQAREKRRLEIRIVVRIERVCVRVGHFPALERRNRKKPAAFYFICSYFSLIPRLFTKTCCLGEMVLLFLLASSSQQAPCSGNGTQNEWESGKRCTRRAHKNGSHCGKSSGQWWDIGSKSSLTTLATT